jgi:hypothetical protein
MKSRTLFTVVAVAVTLLSTAAYAQAPAPATSPPGAPATAGPPSASAIDAARKHYEAGITMFDTGDYEPALTEFERAYQLAPNYRIFYNLGKIHRMLKDYVQALKDFQRFLSDGTDQPADKKSEVTQYIKELNAVVAKVTVTSNVAGADISVDSVVVGKTPSSDPILVNPGSRTVSVSMAGYVPASKSVRVAPQDAVQVELNPTIPSVQVTRKETQRSSMPWIIPVGWITTGVLVAGSATFGGLALSEQSTLKNTKTQSEPNNLNSLHNTMTTYATVSDICTGVAVVTGLISTYFTVKWLTTPYKDTVTPGAGVGVGPTSVMVYGSFM